MEVEFSTSSGCFGASERRRETSTTGGVEEKRGDLGSRHGGTYQPEARSDPADAGDNENDDESKPGAPADCMASSGGSAQAEETASGECGRDDSRFYAVG